MWASPKYNRVSTKKCQVSWVWSVRVQCFSSVYSHFPLKLCDIDHSTPSPPISHSHHCDSGTWLRGVWGFFHTIEQFSDANWVAYNSAQLWHYLPGDSIRSHSLRPQSCKTALPPLQMPITSPGCHLCFWPTGYRPEVPTTPFLGSINLLEQLTELIATFYLPFILKRIQLRNNQPKEMHRVRYAEKGEQIPHSLNAQLSLHLHVFTNP